MSWCHRITLSLSFNKLCICTTILRSTALSLKVLFIFVMHDLNGASFLKVGFLFYLLGLRVPVTLNRSIFNNPSLRFFYLTLYIIRLIDRVYLSSLLICYPCSFYFHTLMLVSLWDWKLPSFNDTRKY